MTGKFLNKDKTINFSKDSPLYKEMLKPQIMLVRHRGFSSFFKNRKLNEKINDDWKRANPDKVRKPKRQEQQGLNLEMTKDEYLRQEREKTQRKSSVLKMQYK